MATKRFTGTVVIPRANDEEFFFVNLYGENRDETFNMQDVCEELDIVEDRVYKFTITAVRVPGT